MINCCDPCAERKPSIGVDEWRDILCFPSPYYFWQQAQDEFIYPETPIPYKPLDHCNQIVFCRKNSHYGLGRHEVYKAILESDRQYHDMVGYWPSATFGCDEVPVNPCTRRVCLDSSKLIELGSEALELLYTVQILPIDNEGDPLDITDDNGDGVLDTVTIEIADTGIPHDEIVILFAKDDWANKSRWEHEIRPTCIEDIGNDTLQITFSSWLLVKPKLLCNQPYQVFDPNDVTIYAMVVEVWRRYADDSNAVTYWHKPSLCGCHCPCGKVICNCLQPVEGCACIVNHDLGVIELQPPLDPCCKQMCIEKVCINYLSGGCGDDDLIAHLAASNLPCMPEKSCCGVSKCIDYWQADFVGVTDRGKIATTLTELERSNPFGTKRGHIEAFKQLRRRNDRRTSVRSI